MENELQEMRDLVAQLQLDNERLRQERAAVERPDPVAPSSSAAPSGSAARPSTPRSADVAASTVERFVFIPRDRRCPNFNGRSGVSLDEWLEEARACMRVRNMTPEEQAFFLYDHLEGEARNEIKYRSSADKSDPDKIIAALREVYGCAESYIALQEAFFSRRQREGETLLEFSLELLGLFEKVKNQSPCEVLNGDVIVRDQFVECVSDNALRRELKQLIRRQPTVTLLEVRGEAIRWEREGLPGGVRGRSQSVPLVSGIQYEVRGSPEMGWAQRNRTSELSELREILHRQQQQLDLLTQTIARNQTTFSHGRAPRPTQLICRRCQQPGHFARECDGERRPPRAPPGPVVAPSAGEPRSLPGPNRPEN
nr:uncharacterized protein LOC129429861 [Misgurnus anguillicaudatus]